MDAHSTRLFGAISDSSVGNRELLRSRLPWYFDRGIQMDPPFAHFLSDAEIRQCADWFVETTDDPFIGESGVIAVSFLASLILTNQISRVVQLGHYAGFGSMILGMILRKVSPEARLISFDIDARMNGFCDDLVRRLGLDKHVTHACMDSTDPQTLEVAAQVLSSAPQLLFIDASKQYRNTVAEVSMWARHIDGYIIAHDVSAAAKHQQANGSLGVSDGLADSKQFTPHQLLILDPQTEVRAGFPYLDPCGLGIGICHGRDPLPLPTCSLENLLARRRILEPTKLASAENWFLEGPFSFGQRGLFNKRGRLIKKRGASGWANCFAPIQPGQRLTCEISVRSSDNSEVLVCAGGNPGSSFVSAGAGTRTGELTVGRENPFVGIFGSPSSQFEVESLRVYAVQ
jgi:predicted O-methyltransferase YrrM